MLRTLLVMKGLRIATPLQQAASRENLKKAREARLQALRASGVTLRETGREDEDVLYRGNPDPVGVSTRIDFDLRVPHQKDWDGEEYQYEGEDEPHNLRDIASDMVSAEDSTLKEVEVDNWTYDKAKKELLAKVRASAPVRYRR